jgi:hypothetical protein
MTGWAVDDRLARIETKAETDEDKDRRDGLNHEER